MQGCVSTLDGKELDAESRLAADRGRCLSAISVDRCELSSQ